MSKCGWCMESRHEQCPRKWQLWRAEHKKVGRVTKFVVTYLNEYATCDCMTGTHPKEEDNED